MSRRWYKKKIDSAKSYVDKMFKEGGRIEDKDMIMQFVTPFKAEITPKKMTIEEFHRQLVLGLNKRKLLKYVACYIKDDKVIMEKV